MEQHLNLLDLVIGRERDAAVSPARDTLFCAFFAKLNSPSLLPYHYYLQLIFKRTESILRAFRPFSSARGSCCFSHYNDNAESFRPFEGFRRHRIKPQGRVRADFLRGRVCCTHDRKMLPFIFERYTRAPLQQKVKRRLVTGGAALYPPHQQGLLSLAVLEGSHPPPGAPTPRPH